MNEDKYYLEERPVYEVLRARADQLEVEANTFPPKTEVRTKLYVEAAKLRAEAEILLMR